MCNSLLSIQLFKQVTPFLCPCTFVIFFLLLSSSLLLLLLLVLLFVTVSARNCTHLLREQHHVFFLLVSPSLSSLSPLFIIPEKLDTIFFFLTWSLSLTPLVLDRMKCTLRFSRRSSAISDLDERRIALSRVQTGAKCSHSFSCKAHAQRGTEQNFERSRLCSSTRLFVNMGCTQLLSRGEEQNKSACQGLARLTRTIDTLFNYSKTREDLQLQTIDAQSEEHLKIAAADRAELPRVELALLCCTR